MESIDPEITIITTSKQKPKTLTLFGSNGQSYKFLLKAGLDGLRPSRRPRRRPQEFERSERSVNP